MKITSRQIEIMSHLTTTAIARGEWLDIDELIPLLASVGSKQSVQCSLRYLERGEQIERFYGTRRGRRRVILIPTPLGISTFAGKTPKP